MSNEWKAVPVSSSELIRLGGTNFFNMQSVQDLQTVESTAPAFHTRVLNALKASGKVRDDGTHYDATLPIHAPINRQMNNFGRGARVYDRTKSVKCTIIHANAGYTRKTRTPVHRVADRSGDTWLAKESELKLLL